jgi:hypothetical protein
MRGQEREDSGAADLIFTAPIYEVMLRDEFRSEYIRIHLVEENNTRGIRAEDC